MADLHDLRLARKRSPIPIPESACRIIGDFGMEEPNTHNNVSMSLRRLKRGVEIMLSVKVGRGAFSWNLSCMEDVYPQNFAAAREWAAAYAARYGQTLHEIIKPREPRPTGDDRKLFKSGGCREAWLRSDVPALWAEAALRCQHAGAFCMSDGYCHFGNCSMEMDPAEPDADSARSNPPKEGEND